MGRWVCGGGVGVWVWGGVCGEVCVGRWCGCGELSVGVMWEGVGDGCRLWSM